MTYKEVIAGQIQYLPLWNFGIFCNIFHPYLYDFIVEESMHVKGWLCYIYVEGRFIFMWFEIRVPFHSYACVYSSPIIILWKDHCFINWMLSALWNIESRSICLFWGHFIQFHLNAYVNGSIAKFYMLLLCILTYMTLGNMRLQVWFCVSTLFFFLGVQRKIIWLLKSAFVFFAKF